MYKISRGVHLVCRRIPRNDVHGSAAKVRRLSSRNCRALPFLLPERHPSNCMLDARRAVVHGLPVRMVRAYASGSGSLPQHTSVPLPALSPTMERGSIKGWEKKEGDKLSEGDLLALIETDKATMDFETPEEGYLAKILTPAGSKDVPLGQIVCIIVPNKEDVDAFKSYTLEQAQAGQTNKQGGKTEVKASERETAETERSKSTASSKDQSSSSKDQESSASPDKGNYPNHTKVNLPALSPTVDKSTIKSWNKKEGDVIKEGDLIAQVETDKATIDWNWENQEEVYVAKLFVPDGTADVPVGQLVAIFVNNKDDVAAFKDMKADTATAAAAPQKKSEQSDSQPQKEQARQKDKGDESAGGRPQPEEGQKRPEGGRVFASPLARSLAQSKGYDLSQIRGTGPDGRIIAEDVNNYQPSASKAAKTDESARPSSTKSKSAVSEEGTFQDIPMTNMRQIIAKRLLQSKQTIPHYYLSVDVVLDEVMEIRKELNEIMEKEKVKISVNDFIIKASALACKKVPAANSAWMDTFIRQFNAVDVSVAVSTEAGLITPIVFNADTKGLADINADVVRLADAARKGKLKPQEFQGGTFTVSNLGMFGIKNFSAVINPPQSCILAVGGAQKQLIVDERSKEGHKIATVMSVTLSCDHRVVDGAVGAEWLKHFKKFLEQPETMLL